MTLDVDVPLNPNIHLRVCVSWSHSATAAVIVLKFLKISGDWRYKTVSFKNPHKKKIGKVLNLEI